MAQRIVDHSVTLGSIAEGAKLEAEKAKHLAEQIKEQVKEEIATKKSTQANIEDTVNADAVDKTGKAKEEVKAKNSPKSNKQKRKRGKKYKDALKKIDKSKTYDLVSAIKILKGLKLANFNESVEIHVNLGIDPNNNDQRIRFTTTLPHGTGKSVTVLVISDDTSGKKDNVIYRDKSVVDEIVKGKFVPGKDFDVVITKPEFMKDVAKTARVLGPKGAMPSPKNGTVTSNIDKAIEQFSKGQIEIRNQSAHAVLHQVVGKIDFSTDDLVKNINFLLAEVEKNKPLKTKKKFIQSIYVKTTMSPSIKVTQ